MPKELFYLTLRKHVYSNTMYTENFTTKEMKKIQIKKKTYVFIFLLKT